MKNASAAFNPIFFISQRKEAKNMTAINPKDNPSPTGNAKAGNYPIRALIVLTAVLFVVDSVETMVLPGIPTMEKDLSTTITIGSWITSIVLLVGAAVSPIFGKLGDLYGKKKIIIVTLVFYTFGVSIAGFSTNIYFLIFASNARRGLCHNPAIACSAHRHISQGKIGHRSGSRRRLVCHWPFIGVSAWSLRYSKPWRAFLLSVGIALVLVYTTAGSALGWFSLEEIVILIFGLH